MRDPQPSDDLVRVAVEHAAHRHAREDPARSDDHPSDDMLIAYADGRSEGSARETLEEHLALCRSCREAVVETRRFIAGDDPAADLPAEAVAEARRRYDRRRRHTASDGRPGPAEEPTTARRLPDPPRAPAPRWPFALAATLAVAAIGLAWLVALRDDGFEPNPQVIPLAPGIERTPGIPPKVIEVDRSVTLLLAAEGCPRGRLTLLDGDGVERFRSEAALLADADDRFTATLAPAHFPPGPMTIRVHTQGCTTPVLDYVLDVVRPRD